MPVAQQDFGPLLLGVALQTIAFMLLTPCSFTEIKCKKQPEVINSGPDFHIHHGCFVHCCSAHSLSFELVPKRQTLQDIVYLDLFTYVQAIKSYLHWLSIIGLPGALQARARSLR